MLDDINYPSEERRRVHAFDWRRVKDEHFMQCFAEDDALVEAVGLYLHKTLASGKAGIIVATPAHVAGVENVLARQGLDCEELQRRGRYIPLDAAETLRRISVNGRPNRSLFYEVIGRLISQASNSWGEVRAFGEMVNLLWMEGKRAEALELEDLWNGLGKIYPFALFCAYSKDAFDCGDDQESFSRVCEAHSMVIL